MGLQLGKEPVTLPWGEPKDSRGSEELPTPTLGALESSAVLQNLCVCILEDCFLHWCLMIMHLCWVWDTVSACVTDRARGHLLIHTCDTCHFFVGGRLKCSLPPLLKCTRGVGWPESTAGVVGHWYVFFPLATPVHLLTDISGTGFRLFPVRTAAKWWPRWAGAISSEAPLC